MLFLLNMEKFVGSIYRGNKYNRLYPTMIAIKNGMYLLLYLYKGFDKIRFWMPSSWGGRI